MISAGRALFMILFAFFWGGLTFYTGVVVRVSHRVLDDAMYGGLITQRVTTFLQVAGAVTAVAMLCNAGYVIRHNRRLGFALLALGLVVALSIVGLFIVHSDLDAVIDPAAVEVTDYDVFDTGHRRYNQLTTIEWLASLSYLAVTVSAWRKIDSAAANTTRA